MLTGLVKVYEFLLCRPSLVWAHRLLLRVAVKGLGVYTRTGENRFLQRLLAGREAPVVVDVGANVGWYSRMARRASPSARILAVEPHPETFSRLQQAAADCSLEPVCIGIGNTEGTAELHDPEGENGSSHASLHREAIAALQQRETSAREVPVTTLDRLLEERGIDHVDLLKIDTEGSEWAVLQGAEQALADGRIDVIQFEFNSMNVITGIFFKAFYDRLSEFRLFRLLPAGLAEITRYDAFSCELYGPQNIVAVRRENRIPEPMRRRLGL